MPRPAISVGKVPPLKVGTKESDKIVSQAREDPRPPASAPSARYACGSSARIARRPAGAAGRRGAAVAERTFRRLDAPELLAEVADGVAYVNGERVKPSQSAAEKKVAA